MNVEVLRMRRRPAAGNSPFGRGMRRARLVCGLGLSTAGVLLFVHSLVREVPVLWSALDPAVRAAGWGGAMAAAATALGTLPIVLSRRVSGREMTAMLAFSAGVMLAASMFSLLLPAYQAGLALAFPAAVALRVCVLAAAAGAALLLALDWLCGLFRTIASPLEGADQTAARTLRRSWLFVLAIVLHNVPEGLSIGVGYAGIDAPHAHSLALAIALQDLPEGLVVALALHAVGYGRRFSLATGMASGLVEPVGAVAGALLVGVSSFVLPWALAAAAGAMLFAIVHEIMPMLLRGEHRRFGAVMLLIGFALMAAMDNLFTAAPP
jgi:ZIP family zinc transporter